MKAAGLLLALLSTDAFAGWVAEVLPEEATFVAGRVILWYSPEADDGTPTFADAVKRLKESGRAERLERISLHWFLRHNKQFQRELFAALEQSAPQELAQARLKPRKITLGRQFDVAVLQTPTVQSIARELVSAGLRIDQVEHEKLMLLREADSERFDCLLYFNVTRQ